MIVGIMNIEQTIRALGGPLKVRNMMTRTVSRSAVDQWMRGVRPVPHDLHADFYRVCDRAGVPRPILRIGKRTGRPKRVTK